MDQETLYWTIGLTVSLFIGLLGAVGIYLREIYNSPPRKAKRDAKNKQKRIEKEKLALNKLNLDGVEMVRFAEYYFKCLKTGYLIEEYKAVLDRYVPKTFSTMAQKKKLKNICEKYIPYEHNIVKIEDDKRFYINASWIPGSSGDRHYIATQIPIQQTIWDFWRMIWYHYSNFIVMIGEDINNSPEIFNYTNPDCYSASSPFKIEIERSYITMDFKIRIIRLINGQYYRPITHIQFLTWTNIRVTSPQIILEVRRQMKRSAESTGGPIVVHCVAGCGRTGTFISISNLCDFVDKCKEERRDEKISVPHEVIKMRENRVMSVANVSQYTIIYETVIQYVVGGITAMPIDSLQDEMATLSLKSVNTGLTKFHRQFSNANKMSENLPLVECAGGIRDENIDKNRHPLVVPRDCDRPYLKNIKMEGTSDYINGVYLDSFCVKSHFIVTQWPMKNTLNDIWRLLYDKNIKVMIVLNVFENSKKFRQFWPTILHQQTGSGPISVQLIEDNPITPSIRCQIFRLAMINFEIKNSDVSLLQAKGLTIKRRFQTDKLYWDVAIFHLLNWKNNSHVPDKLQDVIDLIWLTEEFNSSGGYTTTSGSPIVVMSEDGVKRAGVYCVVAACLERMRLYGDVDVYGAVMNVKRYRPQLICDIEEYLLCYELCLEYLSWSDNDEERPSDIVIQS